MVFVNTTQLGKELDRDASVLVFDKPLDNSKQFTLGYGYWQHTLWCIQGIEESLKTLALYVR